MMILRRNNVFYAMWIGAQYRVNAAEASALLDLPILPKRDLPANCGPISGSKIGALFEELLRKGVLVGGKANFYNLDDRKDA